MVKICSVARVAAQAAEAGHTQHKNQKQQQSGPVTGGYKLSNDGNWPVAMEKAVTVVLYKASLYIQCQQIEHPLGWYIIIFRPVTERYGSIVQAGLLMYGRCCLVRATGFL